MDKSHIGLKYAFCAIYCDITPISPFLFEFTYQHKMKTPGHRRQERIIFIEKKGEYVFLQGDPRPDAILAASREV